MSEWVKVLAGKLHLSSVPKVHIVRTDSYTHPMAHASPPTPTTHTNFKHKLFFFKVKLSVVSLVPAPKGAEISVLEAPT